MALDAATAKWEVPSYSVRADAFRQAASGLHFILGLTRPASTRGSTQTLCVTQAQSNGASVKREVTRRKILPTFRVDIAEFGLLWERVLALFEDTAKVHCSLTVELPLETLKFGDLEELRQYQGLPATLTKFSLWFHQGDRHISMKSSGILGSKPEVSVGGESDAWCAGAVETVFIFFLQHKAPYHWFVVAPIGWALMVLSYGAGLAAFFAPKDTKVPVTAFIGWVALTVAFALLYAMRTKLFPMAALLIRQNQSFLGKHVAELSLFVAVVSAILTVVGWFFTK